MSADENRPVLAGLLALVGVAVAVGLVAALAVMAGAHVLGLGGGHAANVAGAANGTMVVPKPEKTQPASGPSITLGSEPTNSPSSTKSPTIHKPKKRIATIRKAEKQLAAASRAVRKAGKRKTITSPCRDTLVALLSAKKDVLRALRST